MNQVWDAARFGRLLSAHMAQNRRSYLWFGGVAAIVDLILLVLMFALATKDSTYFFSFFDFESQVPWFWIGLYTTGIIFATRYFESLSNPGATLVMLMRPASVFEKWLLAVLVVGIGFPMAFAALYTVLHWPFVMLAQALYVLPEDSYRSSPLDFRIYVPLFSTLASAADQKHTHNDLVNEMIGLLVLTGLQAFCLSCKVFFKTAAVLKMTVLTFFVLLLIFVLTIASDLSFNHVTRYWRVDTAPDFHFTFWEAMLTHMVVFGVPLMLWGMVFVNLQEREVS